MSARMTSSQLVTATYVTLTHAIALIENSHDDEALAFLRELKDKAEQYHNGGNRNDISPQ